MSVIDLHGDRRWNPKKGGDGGGEERDNYRQWQARQVVAILPEDATEALKVLEWAVAIITFLRDAPKPS